MAKRTTAVDRVMRRTILKATTVTMGVSALSGSAIARAAQDESDDGEEFHIPELDLETLEAELGDEVVQAESYADRWPGSTIYVGEAAGHPDLFVSVIRRGEADEAGNDLAVYLCNGEIGTAVQEAEVLWLTGAFEEDGVTLTIEDALEDAEVDLDEEDRERVDEDVTVRLAQVEDAFLGAAIELDEEPVPFLAAEGTDDAGVYVADSERGAEGSIRWIVLPDGRQRGVWCCPPIPCFFPCVLQ